jgi:enoyl-CoA hydratase/carnithine racemase
MGLEIARVLRGVGPEIKLVRLRGNGANFSKGRQAPQIDRENSTALALRRPVAEVPLELYSAIKECRAPTLAIVQGEALGVGCALAAVCDLTIAAEDAIFQVPELNHGIAPTLVMWALIGRASHKTVAHLVYTRERITAQRAEFLGLVTKVVPPAALEAEAEKLAQSLLDRPAASLQAIKEFLKFGSRMDPASAQAFSSVLNAAVSSSAPRK